jgi:Bacterial protein of unknown function (DUF899)
MAQGEVNYNYTTQEFPSDEAPGISVFYKDADGNVFHTYSTYGRGTEPLVGTYMILDMVCFRAFSDIVTLRRPRRSRSFGFMHCMTGSIGAMCFGRRGRRYGRKMRARRWRRFDGAATRTS